jgi:peptidoglycan/xylan/chitin deacetylase (PgdA/CDA1 family)
MTGAPRPWEWKEPEWRGLVGRVRAGRPLRPPAWPDGARCAVALSFDCDHETTELGAGAHAVGRLAWGEFGRRVGAPRILELLAAHGVRASFFVPAVVALLDPDEPRRITAHGHEIGLHGWIHENTSLLQRDVERELMLRARDVLEKAAGIAPVGHRAAQWDLSPHTMALVKELGLDYDSSMMADEACYEILLEGEPSGVVEVPVEWSRDDAVYLGFARNPATRPYMPPRAVLDIFMKEFDEAYEQGGLFQLVLHPFIIGYRSRLWVLDELIRHARSRQGVWFGAHAEVARWARDNAP